MQYHVCGRLTFLQVALFLAAGSSALSEDWYQWRGPDRTDVSKETGLLRDWPAGGPRRVWLYKKAGSGYSGPAIAGGKLFTMGTRDGTEILIALNADTGDELWTARIGPALQNNWGDGPRGTPTVDGDRVYTLGGQGNLICAQVADGKEAWHSSMQELGGKIPGWGYTESVLVDGKQVVCTPGGDKGAIAALDKMTGALLWQSKEFTDAAQYSSIVPANHDGARQYVQLTTRNVVGIAPADGKLLWKSAFPGRTAVIPTPIFHDDCVYVTAGYGAGCKLVKLGPGNQVSEVYANQQMKNHHGGVVQVGDYLYGYSDGVGWLCQEFKTGKEVWSERKAFDKGALSCADGMLYCLEEKSGTVALVEASPKGWKEHGRFTLDPQTSIRSPEGRIWTHPVVANGKLYLRDQDLVFCYDVKQSENSSQ